jgi:DNA-binding transcriptional LysR family regulator
MARAAAELGVSQPSLSELIADLEHTLGVRLFDRSARGVELTVYGEALLARGQAAFAELRRTARYRISQGPSAKWAKVIHFAALKPEGKAAYLLRIGTSEARNAPS